MNEESFQRENTDQLLGEGLAADADPIQDELERKELLMKVANARFRKLEGYIHSGLINQAEALDAGDRQGAQRATAELQELGERYRLHDDAYRPTREIIKELENELESLARKWGVPADEEGWSRN